MTIIDTIVLIKELVLATGGVILTGALTYSAMKNYRKLKPIRFTLCKISQAKDVPISDLRSLISTTTSECESDSSEERLVIVRGIIKESSRNWPSLNLDVLISEVSKKKCVILEQTWDRVPLKELPKHLDGKNDVFERTTSLHKIPIILSASAQGKCSDDVFINLEDSSPKTPLTLVFDVSQEKFSGIRCPIRFASSPEVLVKEKILPVGKELSVIGICSLHEGNPQIRACKELPCFISELTKREMVSKLCVRRDNLILGGVLLGVASLYVFRKTLKRILCLWRGWKRCKGNNRNENYPGHPRDRRNENYPGYPRDWRNENYPGHPRDWRYDNCPVHPRDSRYENYPVHPSDWRNENYPGYPRDGEMKTIQDTL